MKNYNSINQYIEEFPTEIQEKLEKIRKVIHESAPKAEEAISYGMPTFKLNKKNLVHFAAFKKHIGFYPAPSGISNFEDELAPYVHAKGSIQFPLDMPIPYDLIKKVVKFRVKESNQK